MNSDKSLLSAAKGGRKIAEFSSGSGYGCMLPRSKEGRRTFTCGRASLRSRARARARPRRGGCSREEGTWEKKREPTEARRDRLLRHSCNFPVVSRLVNSR